jgi:hypothetical protein
MSFEVYILLLTVVALVIRWLLFTLYEATDDGPSFLAFMFDTRRYPQDRFRLPMLVLMFGAGLIGFYLFE